MILLNKEPINITVFPDGTSQVWKLTNIQPLNTIQWIFQTESELFLLLQLSCLLKKYYTELYIPYLPYARQDKEIDNDATFALKPFADVLNLCTFDKIIITDPHSEKALKLIRKSEAVYPHMLLAFALKRTDATMVVYPDAGALTKYNREYAEVTQTVYVAYGEKTRDPSTGKITDYKIGVKADGRNVLIVDDICDGGATFVLLTQALLQKGAKEVNLFVSHGIFSRGLEILREAGIKRIFTKAGEILSEENNDHRRL
jgi:ribose-phosphate pyrophosphokinase